MQCPYQGLINYVSIIPSLLRINKLISLKLMKSCKCPQSNWFYGRYAHFVCWERSLKDIPPII